MASIGNLKEDAATEGEAAQRRSRSKKGDLVAIALVCGSARHFNKLEKLLIENTVQQLPELAALARGKRHSFGRLLLEDRQAVGRCLNDPSTSPALRSSGAMSGLRASVDVFGYIEAGKRRGIIIGNGWVMTRCASLEDVYLLRKAAEAGIPFAAAGLFDNDGVVEVRAAESVGKKLCICEPLYERYLGAQEKWPEDLHAIVSHIDNERACDLVSVAGAHLIEEYLCDRAIANRTDYLKYGFAVSPDHWRIALHAEAVDWADPTSTPEHAERACLDALASLPLPVTVALRKPLLSKTLLEGQPVRVGMAWPEDGDDPVATVSLEGDDEPIGWVRFDPIVFAATTLPGSRIMYALLPHLTAWICKVRPAWSSDAGSGCYISQKNDGKRFLVQSGDTDYLVQIAFTFARSDLRAAVEDATAALSSHAGERTSAPWDRTRVPRIALGSEEGVKPWPKTGKAQTNRKNKLKKASPRGCSVASLSKLYRAGGWPMSFSESDAGTSVPVPLSLVDLNTKARQAVFELVLIEIDEAGSPEPTKETVLWCLGMRSLEFDGMFFEEPKTDELGEREGIEVIGELERGGYTARAVKVSAIARVTPQHVLYALAGRGLFDYEMMAGYKPLSHP